MTLEQISKLDKGTKVYKIINQTITGYKIVDKLSYGEDIEYLYLAHDSDARDCTGFSIKHDTSIFFDNYDDAKNELWKRVVKKINSINNIYFDNKKRIVLH